MGIIDTTKKRARTMSRNTQQQRDLDLTGGFRLDLKTLTLIALLICSWYSQGGKIDQLNQRMDSQEKSRSEIEAARRDAEAAHAETAVAQQKALSDGLNELKAQLKMTALDVGDLKLQTGIRKEK